jgi:hypothetical protein
MRTAHETAEWQQYLTHDEVDLMMECAATLPSEAIVVAIGAGAARTLRRSGDHRRCAYLPVDIRSMGPSLDQRTLAFS